MTTKIEWTEATWSPITGCTRVSKGCEHCYAERLSHRLSHIPSTAEKYRGITKNGRWTGLVRCHPDVLAKVPSAKMIFVNSMSDTFHPDVPWEFLDDLMHVIRERPCQIFQLLTKRPENARDFLFWWYRKRLPDMLPNLWLGVSVEDQKTADERIPILVQTHAAVRFVSYEPALGAVDFTGPVYVEGHACSPKIDSIDAREMWMPRLHWVIVGGESGPGARPMHPDWVRSVRDQCQAAGVAYFFKQWGEWLSHANALEIVGDDHPMVCDQSYRVRGRKHLTALDGITMIRVGRKKAGRVLDGRTWDEMPVTQ